MVFFKFLDVEAVETCGTMEKIIKNIFPPRRSMKNYKKYFCLWMRKLQHLNLWRSHDGKNLKKYFFFRKEWGNIIKSIFCLYVIYFFPQHAFNKN